MTRCSSNNVVELMWLVGEKVACLQCLKKWGFRRCEDICWIKTNIRSRQNRALEPNAVFNRTKVRMTCCYSLYGQVMCMQVDASVFACVRLTSNHCINCEIFTGRLVHPFDWLQESLSSN